MKKKIVFLLFLVSGSICFSQPLSGENQEKPIVIHKEKRQFVQLKDRNYLKQQNDKKTEGQKDSVNTETKLSVKQFIHDGLAKEKETDFKEAFFDYTKALTLDPGNPEALYNKAYCQYRLEEYANAIADFNTAIDHDSLSAEIFYCRGNVNFDMKNFTEAIADYSKALSLDSTDGECFFNRAAARLQMGMKKEACADLEMAEKNGDKAAAEVFREVCEKK